tara:strand:+ start:186 stop:404 length:219 start_codon:yes stop_codon:yes gene_type:complete
MQVGDLVQCGEETGIIIAIDPYYTESNGAEACDWINVLWSGAEDTSYGSAEIEGVSRSDVDYWLKEGVWTRP